MDCSRLLLLLCLVTALPAQPASTPARPKGLPELGGALRTTLDQIVADGRRAARVRGGGLVVGILAEDVRGFVAYGESGRGDGLALDQDSMFEIGSITKSFTSMLLVALMESGELRLVTPVSELLPDGVAMPMRDDVPITLEHLVLHASGLPRLPTNFKPQGRDPYVNYGTKELYEFLGGHKLVRAPEESLEYSNLGFGLLGHVLARSKETDYESLLRDRVLTPLGLQDTMIHLDAAARARLVRGTTRRGRPAPNWSFDVLAGAGALRSSLRDMMKLLDQLVDPESSALAKVIRRCEPVRRQPMPTSGRTLAWFEERQDVEPGEDEGWRYLWHNGGTGGYASFIGWIPERRCGAVILASNAFDVTKHVAQPLMRALHER